MIVLITNIMQWSHFRLNGRLSALAYLLLAVMPVCALRAQLVYEESFSNTSAPGWEFQSDSSGTSPGPRLTAAAVPDAYDPESGAPAIDNPGNGWLRLATTRGNQSNAAALDTAFAAQGAEITIGFDFAFWKPGGRPADGITAFLWDASQSFDPGGFGGSLGYANRSGADGLGGGYVGAGLDVFGNFSNPTESRNGGTGRRPGEVAVRGPGSGQSGYSFLGGTDSGSVDSLTDTFGSGFRMDFPNSPTRPDQDAADYRRFEMTLDAANNLTVRMQDGFSGTLTDLFTVAVPGLRPEQLRFGFAGSTGGRDEVYEVRNLRIEVNGGTNAFYWDNEAGNTFANTPLNWDQDAVPTNHSHVFFTDQFPDTQVPQTVDVNTALILNSATFNGATEYSLTGQTLTFDTDGAGASYINVLPGANAAADNEISNNLNLNNALQVQNLADRSLTLGGNVNTDGFDLGFTTAADGSIEVDGTISDNGDVTVSGFGETVFNSSNTYSGVTTVEGGVLRLTNGDALGNTTGDTIVQSGGTLSLSNNISTAWNEEISIEGGGANGRGALLNQSGNNNVSGIVTLTDDATISSESGLLFMNRFGNNAVRTGNGYTITFDAASGAEIDVAGEIDESGSGSSDLVKNGNGLLTLRSNSNYTGTTTINAGTLAILNNGSLGTNAGDTVVNDGGTLELVNSKKINSGESLTLEGDGASGKAALWQSGGGTGEWNGGVTLTGGGASMGADTGVLRIDGVISGTDQSLTVEGDGTVELRSNNTYTGETFVESGTLRTVGNERINDNSALRLADTSGAEFRMAGNNNTETVANISGGGANGGDIHLQSNNTLVFGGNDEDTSFGGDFIAWSNGNVIKEGSGNTILTGDHNSLQGDVRIDEGTLTLAAANSFSDFNTDFTLNGGTLAIDGVSETTGSFMLQNTSSIDFLGQSGGYLTFDDMTRSNGNLTVDNWIGDLSGNGDTRLQVTASSLSGSLLNNVSFSGWGNGTELINLGSGLYELVPDLSGWYEWDSDTGNNNWSNKNNWDIDGSNPSSPPNSVTAQVLIADADPNLASDGINTGSGNFWQIRDMVIDNDTAFDISGSRAIRFNQPGNGDTFLTVSGGSSPTFNTRVEAWDPLVIRNNSTGTTTFAGGFDIVDQSLTEALLNFGGSGTTLVSGDILASTSDPLVVTKDGSGTLRLTGNNSQIDGRFVLNEGTVEVGSNTALGSGSGSDAIIINGGRVAGFGGDRTLDENYTINNDFTVGNSDSSSVTLTGVGTLASGLQGVTVEGGVGLTLTGDVDGAGGINKKGAGSLFLTDNDSEFSGGIRIEEGELYAIDPDAQTDFTFGADVANQTLFGNSTQFTITGGEGGVILDRGGDITIASAGNIDVEGGSAFFYNYDNTTPQSATAGDIAIAGNINVSGGTLEFGSNRDLDLDPGADLSLTGGTTNLYFDRDFSTGGTGANPATINVSNGADLNLFGFESGGSEVVFDSDDTIQVAGSGSNLSIDPGAGGRTDFNGKLILSDDGTASVTNGEVNFIGNAQLNGGTAPNNGTLRLTDADLSIDQDTEIVNAPNVTFEITGAGTQSLDAPDPSTNIENLGTLRLTGNGTLEIETNVNNVQAQEILIEGGTLLNNASDQIENDTPMNLAGGTWNTDGYDEVLGTLTLSDTSTIDLGAGDSVINFADSAARIWDSGQTLTITNWSGNADGGGTDQVIFGNSLAALTGQQLNQIVFSNPFGDGKDYGSRILPTGEIVPIPEPSTILAAVMLIAAAGIYEYRRRKKNGIHAETPSGG